MLRNFFLNRATSRELASRLSTRDLQFALNEREAVEAKFVDLGERRQVRVSGPAWITVNKD